MRLTIALSASVLLFAASLFAQEQSLGDVARQARSTPSAKAKHVLTDDEIAPKTLTGEEDPNAVVTEAANRLVNDKDHRCREEASGNSGPGWIDNRTIEVAGDDRVRLIFEQPKDTPSRREVILIGSNAFSQTGNEPWRKVAPAEVGLRSVKESAAAVLPDPFKFAYPPGELKLTGHESLDGVRTFVYAWSTHSSSLDRSIKIWIGAEDVLPRRTEMQTYDRDIGTRWTQTSMCSYAIHPTIEPPL